MKIHNTNTTVTVTPTIAPIGNPWPVLEVGGIGDIDGPEEGVGLRWIVFSDVLNVDTVGQDWDIVGETRTLS